FAGLWNGYFFDSQHRRRSKFGKSQRFHYVGAHHSPIRNGNVPPHLGEIPAVRFVSPSPTKTFAGIRESSVALDNGMRHAVGDVPGANWQARVSGSRINDFGT